MPEIPLSLYVHIPWCVKKCPYCDFNSHTLKKEADEERYVDALIKDFQESLPWIQERSIQTIFFGGGTPSLFKPESYERFLQAIFQEVTVDKRLEITLEANPGTVDEQHFRGYYALGIHRLSLGVQSFNPEKLKRLGRIHTSEQAKKAFSIAREVGFKNINLDLMFGLPDQTVEEALEDVRQALELKPEHLSWYQLTLEPNTVFYKSPPTLPQEGKLWEIEVEGKALIQQAYAQYEISAYSAVGKQCRHNLNYWLFGDYIGIGAGAHGKITRKSREELEIIRFQKKRQPEDYMQKSFLAKQWQVTSHETVFEFMLNALRLFQPIPYDLLTTRTGVTRLSIEDKLIQAEKAGLLIIGESTFEVSPLGHQYLNDLQSIFLY